MMKLKKKYQLKKIDKKIKLIGLIRQTSYMSYKTEITTKKANHNKL
jgi:hypothetical protein